MGTPGVKIAELDKFVLALVIQEVSPLHAGNYTCRALSGTTSASHSGILVVHGKIFKFYQYKLSLMIFSYFQTQFHQLSGRLTLDN